MESKTSLRHPIFHHSICFTLQQFNILKEVPLTWFIPLAISFWNRRGIYSFLPWLLRVTLLPSGQTGGWELWKRLLLSRGALACSLAQPRIQPPLSFLSSYLLPCRGTGAPASCWKPLPRHAMNWVQLDWKAKKQYTTVVFRDNCCVNPRWDNY